jgi:hypothetical protein
MSLAVIGGLVGLAFALVEYFVFGALIDRSVRRGAKGPGPHVFDLVRKGQLVLFPLIGLVIGSILAGGNGE